MLRIGFLEPLLKKKGAEGVAFATPKEEGLTRPSALQERGQVDVVESECNHETAGSPFPVCPETLSLFQS